MNIVGLDLGSYKIKAVEVAIHRAEVELVRLHSAKSPSISLATDSKSALRDYAIALQSFWEEGELESHQVVLALPESQVFTKVIRMPQMSDKELRKAVVWEAEQHIPLPINEASYSYYFLGSLPATREQRRDVLLIAAPKRVVEKYTAVLEEAGLEALAFETASLALARAVVDEDARTVATLVADIGAETTDLAIIVNCGVYLARSISGGGLALDRAISQTFGFEMTQAVEYKENYGLDESQLEGKVAAAIKPVFDMILAEMRKSAAYFKNSYPEFPIKRVVLCGGAARLPGILPYVANALGFEVQLANPWRKLKIPDSLPKSQLSETGSEFAVVVGLALRQFGT